MKQEMVVLAFKIDCPTIDRKKGEIIEMPAVEYMVLRDKTNEQTGKPLDARVNHTRIVDGEEFLTAKKEEVEDVKDTAEVKKKKTAKKAR